MTLQQAAAQRHKTQNTKHKTRMDAAAGIVVLGEGPPRSDVDVDPDEALERYAYWMDVEEAAAFVDGDEDIVTRVLVALLEDDL